MAALRRVALWSAPLLLGVHRAEKVHDLDLSASSFDDECQGQDEGACALSAIQRRLRKVSAQGDDAPDTPDDATFGSEGSSEQTLVPVPKGQVAGVPMEEMGRDELDRLQHRIEEEQLRRDLELATHPVSYDNDTDVDVRQKDLEDPRTIIANIAGGMAPNSAVDWNDPATLGANVAVTACSGRLYSGRRSGSEMCFCQLAGNPGCASTPCACPQGCLGITWKHGSTVVFKNKARASNCGGPTTVLLTAPKEYFRDTSDLMRSGCGGSVIRQLLVDSWNSYQSHVAPGPVWQCFHGAHVASVKYLHLQTFCGSGHFHGMPTSNHYIATCVKMNSIGEASSLASQLAGKLR